MTVYRIKNLTTGLYSTGSAFPGWNKKGKVWTSLGALKGHLTMIANNQYVDHYPAGPNIVVVVHQLVDDQQQFIPQIRGRR